MIKGKIGVDFDGTLSVYHGYDPNNPDHLGEPVPTMLNRVKDWISKGIDVVIFTARVAVEGDVDIERANHQRKLIMDWTEKHVGKRLNVTCLKSRDIIQIWDDRCVQVWPPNSGNPVGDHLKPQSHPFPNGIPK